ncbi:MULTISPECIES: spore cortex biosynthesis protein YabQ [Bacillaceae]|uniref:spore cortex biosynthesis protein YabQ n=1 Tax=Bacillales TaxID=1385 RepID=UPI0018848C6A|nr:MULTISPECIES: spore cortex biosynthesis protein YabQ [Bacillaceae]MBF0709591.1 spore cortex biosynthesis protein YabQ [Pseudalkalibacillus hwajinpoensis]MDO6658531.1 spore cortex biosynthesis protein YabQ [Anaerobacillus sp. 1_MG-2023]
MTLTVQFYTMVAMVAMGVWLGIAMDTYSRFLHPDRSKSLWLYANDIVFWLLQGLIIFYVLYLVNEGELRFYVFLAILCGYAAYRSLFQPLYRRLLERIILITIAIIRFVKSLFIYLIYQPIRFILKVVFSLCMMIVSIMTTIFWFIFKFFWVPLKWGSSLIWRLIPQSVQMPLIKLAGVADKIKNYIYHWLTKIRK